MKAARLSLSSLDRLPAAAPPGSLRPAPQAAVSNLFEALFQSFSSIFIEFSAIFAISAHAERTGLDGIFE